LRKDILHNWNLHLAGLRRWACTPTTPRPDVPTFRGRTQHYRLDKELTAQLIALSRLGGTTLFMLMCAAFQTLLHRYAGQDDIVGGIPHRQSQSSGDL